MTNQTLNIIRDFELDEPGRGTSEGPEAHSSGLIKCHGYFNDCSCGQCDEQFNRQSATVLQNRRN